MNMSYCRFQNTLQDLQDCKDAYRCALNGSEEDKLSRDEINAFAVMINEMQGFLDDIKDSLFTNDLYDITSKDLQDQLPGLAYEA